MELDDPIKPEFASWQSYMHFANGVRHKRRFFLTEAETAFLATVRATNHDRDVELPAGKIFFRAQRGVEWRTLEDDEGNEVGEEPSGYGGARMKPRSNKATEGRANPAGIPVLYLGTTEQTVISEIRPWVGASVSVAQFKLLRSLRAIDLSRGHGQENPFFSMSFEQIAGQMPITPERKSKAVWYDIDNAFSRPVTLSDDAADYVPTQIIAELFRDIGYDAIIYKSQFGEKGFNIALFNTDDADAINCAPYEITEMKVEFKEIGSRWHSAKHYESKSKSP